jgi:signal transduction histidine kinase
MRRTCFAVYQFGAVDYLVKPVNPDILRYKVAVFVELHQLRERVRAQAELLGSERLSLAQAQAAVRAREDVLAIVSHDLGNPIAAIDALAELVARRGFALNDAQLTQLAERQQASVEKMKRLVADLLQVSRLESGSFTLHKEQHEVARLVSQLTEVMAPLASEKVQTLTRTLCDQRWVLCDGDRIYQVLANLVGNAIKYAPRAATIAIRTDSRPGELVFSVEDDGPGIEFADVPRLFDKYWRSAGANRPGVGLGLAIAKAIVDGHGGRIWAESRLGVGSTFCFALPTS